jgi:glycine/serine hydroxymethyltransferase
MACRGFTITEMGEVAELMVRVANGEDPDDVRPAVTAVAQEHSRIYYSFEAGLPPKNFEVGPR